LSGTAAAGSLDAPTLNATTGTMGELPNAASARPSWIRWSIPFAIVLAIAIGGIYEYMRSPARNNAASTAAPAPRASAPAPAAPGPAAPPATAAGASTPLASPIATTLSDDTTTAAPAANTQDASGAALSIATRSGTWVEVRDSTGRTVFSQNVAAGQTQPIAGAPPFEITIGNAPDATVTFRGRVVDLAPHIRQNVARLTLQ